MVPRCTIAKYEQFRVFRTTIRSDKRLKAAPAQPYLHMPLVTCFHWPSGELVVIQIIIQEEQLLHFAIIAWQSLQNWLLKRVRLDIGLLG